LVVLRIIHAPPHLQCPLRSKLDFASAEVLIQLAMSAGRKEGKLCAHAMEAKEEILNCFSLQQNILANERTEQ
jgi:hypothetical protein